MGDSTPTIKRAMRELLNDIYNENFTRKKIIVYGIVYPVGLIAVCMLAEALVRLAVFNTL